MEADSEAPEAALKPSGFYNPGNKKHLLEIISRPNDHSQGADRFSRVLTITMTVKQAGFLKVVNNER